MPAGYSTRSLVDKLGIKPGFRTAFIHAPEGFDRTLGLLPNGVVPLAKVTKDLDFIHAFFTEAARLNKEFPALKNALKQTGSLWISWPKKAAKMDTDLSDNIVRQAGLSHGLVDVKVCAVDEVWSGLKFMVRIKDRS